MGWSLGVIRPLPGESVREAVDRVYAGGFVMECAGDTTLVSRVPGRRRDHTRPTTAERAEMLETIQRLTDLGLDVEVEEERRARRRRWPHWYVLVSEPASMQIDVFVDCAELSVLPGRDHGRAEVEAVAVDRTGTPVATARTARTLTPKRLRAVRLRDGKCRVPGCDRRTGLEAHHLWPASWGGSDEIHNLAMVCTGGSTDHHAQLVPQGPWLLAGNPNHPNGLALVHRREVAELTAQAARSGSRSGSGGPCGSPGGPGP